jgi:hypothetical protein
VESLKMSINLEIESSINDTEKIKCEVKRKGKSENSNRLKHIQDGEMEINGKG